MYTININNTILQQPFAGLQIRQLVKNPRLEILSVSLEKNTVFPSHESHRDTHLVVLEGQIVFYIENHPVVLKEKQEFSFSKDTEHWVEALENSKFLIIR